MLLNTAKITKHKIKKAENSITSFAHVSIKVNRNPYFLLTLN